MYWDRPGVQGGLAYLASYSSSKKSQIIGFLALETWLHFLKSCHLLVFEKIFQGWSKKYGKKYERWDGADGWLLINYFGKNRIFLATVGWKYWLAKFTIEIKLRWFITIKSAFLSEIAFQKDGYLSRKMAIFLERWDFQKDHQLSRKMKFPQRER